MLIVSPHLDDAVFSCGQLLAAHPGTTVVTVLAGMPSPEQPQTEWDTDTGFASAAEAVLARREEDAGAINVVRAESVRLELLDGQYQRPDGHDERLRTELGAVIAAHASEPILVPLGIRHPDHIRVGGAARELAAVLGATIVVYEELPYRVEEPDEHNAARARLAAEGWELEPREETIGPVATKHAAIDCYVSQEAQFARKNLVAEERYFTATRRPS